MKKLFPVLSVLALASLILAACATPTPPPAVQETVVVTSVSVVTEVPTAAPAMPTPVASVDQSTLVQKGKLSVCSDLPYPPFRIL